MKKLIVLFSVFALLNPADFRARFIDFNVELPLGANGALQQVPRRVEIPDNAALAAAVLRDLIQHQEDVIAGRVAQNALNLAYANVALPIFRAELAAEDRRIQDEQKIAAEEKSTRAAQLTPVRRSKVIGKPGDSSKQKKH